MPNSSFPLFHTHTSLRNTAEDLGKNMSFVTPKVKVRMSLVPGFNLDTHSVQWSFSSWVWLCPWPSGEESAPYGAFTQTQPSLLGSTVPCSLQIAAKICRKRSRNIPCGFEGTVTSPKAEASALGRLLWGPLNSLLVL